MKIPTFPNHGTVFYTSGGHKESAFFLNNELIIVSGLIFCDNEALTKNITNSVRQCPVIELNKCDKLKAVAELDFRVIRKSKGGLEESAARACTIVHSVRVKNCLENVLNGLHVFVDGDSKPVQRYSSLYASIVILSTDVTSAPSWEQIKPIFNRWKPVNTESANILDKVIAVSTPFGNESFYNTVNVGHITNIFGDNDCLLLLDIHLSFGCQGGAIYDRNMKIKGFLVGTTFVHRNENVSFPLAINIDEILSITSSGRNLCRSQAIPFPVQAFRSVCMIDSQGCWGTGCAFELNSKYYIISCSHVIATNNITCTFNDRTITGPRLIYKNPTFDSAYDIALMEASFEEAQRSNWFCRLANYIPSVGQRLYAVGFPVFKSLAMGSNFKPSIMPGRVTKYSEGILFTDCSVQYGQSGGPVFDEDGHLIAIAVSNFKSSLDDRIYPFHNMCVPVKDIYSTLVQYSQTNDVSSLNRLQADRIVKSKWKLQPPMILNKL
uniref:Peroxisomal leader peptide-processing protease n=1 Tax=Anopheles atroparvus TaxID=41427 RepID=A0AAG5DBB3_ANOAO